MQALPQANAAPGWSGCSAKPKPPLYLTPVTRDRAEAEEWLQQFEGAGLDGVIAKLEDAPYQPGKRAMLKIKHVRTADCVVAGFRWYKDRTDDAVGSLLLGLYDDAGVLQHVGRDVVVHDGDARGSWRRSWSRCARTRWTTTPGANGPAPAATPSACRARRAAGAAART